MLIRIVDIIFQVYMIMLIIRILGSWVPDLQYSKFMRFIAFYTDPYLGVFSRFIPPLGMIDISPIFAFIFLNILESMVKSLLIGILI